MTALREARGDSSSADPINGTRGKANINERKFAFLNQVTRPDYRSLPTSAATSQSSVPSTPVSVPMRINGNVDQIMFREFGAPIATPEDEEQLLDDLEIKSAPLLSPRRTFADFEDRSSEEKENRRIEEDDDTEADTTIREEFDYEKEEEVLKEEKIIDKPNVETVEEHKENKNESPDFIRMVESAPELTTSFDEKEETNYNKSPEQEIEAEEIRKMTESFGEPRKAVLERVTVEETDDEETETETETENEEMDEKDVYDDVRRQIAAVSDNPMVFGWNAKSNKEQLEKPTSLPLHYELEADCSTPRRAEFSMNPEDDYENQSEDATPATSSGEEGVLQQSLLQLQKQLRKTDVRCSRLEKICEFQQRDIDSLRFEVDWKDKRIEFLQKTLQEIETSTSQSDAPNTSRSTTTSTS
ncbi:PRKC apoptosis WT1 regulator protein [Caenorhabditis elegans]|uniref:PRKC apoptosis WT1 regulator protein n=2 Tax=Caenorhabditis elegans TaxID=6239 RepID=Q93231_CAEEL|nr:PRKC apoptosis WT1 regulator protein [Caenorhabditis elegans]CAB02748.2 PRKC apoptosis WT1 regulator protein [Caenorhabditis elegans]|eukprot:NP_492507.2 Uncharacterized protein CELE_C17E4.10 [Caenorhabditis elegans]